MVDEVKDRLGSPAPPCSPSTEASTVASLAQLRASCARPAASTRSTRTRSSASPPATSASRSRTCSPARPPSPSSTATPPNGGQGAARLRPDQPGARRQGRPARRQGALGREIQALADVEPRGGAAGQAGRRHGGADGPVRRPAPGPAPQLRVRPARRLSTSEGGVSAEPERADRRHDPAAEAATTGDRRSPTTSSRPPPRRRAPKGREAPRGAPPTPRRRTKWQP